MGLGDDIIVTSIAKRANTVTGKPVMVGDGTRIIWSEVFRNNPRITDKISPDAVWVKNVSGNRPYIDYSKSDRTKFVWKPYKVEPGEIYFSADELRWQQKGFVYIEPNVKGSFGGNKDWGFNRWQEVVNNLPGIWFVQGTGKKLNNVDQLETKSFRDACALLSRASLFIGTDGGMHHAAAALGKRAVVVWGGLVGPNTLGYDFHTNLCKSKTFCGSQLTCPHCRQALDSITVTEVCDAVVAAYSDEKQTEAA